MTTLMRSAAVLAVGLFVAFGTVGCDDNHGGGGGTTTTSFGGTTTTLVTTTTIATTTTLPVTTTTLGGVCHLECAVTWGVSNTVTLGALQFDTNYAAADGQMEGSADQVVCTDLTGSLATFNDVDATSTLSAGFISLAGIVAPKDVMRCNFNTANGDVTAPANGDFAVTVIDATDPSLNPVTANVAVNNVQCVQVCTGGTTTTVSTSTTTGGSTTTTTGGGGAKYTIGFVMADAVTIGALQFSVDYSGANGGFDGSADTVACTDQSGSLASFNDVEASSTLNAGFISLAGFSGPDKLVANCTFTSNGGPPAPTDFPVSVTDATDPSLNPIAPLPTVTATVTAQ